MDTNISIGWTQNGIARWKAMWFRAWYPTILHSHTQNTSMPISPWPLQHGILTKFSIFTNLVGFKMASQCNFNLICISFTIREIEHLFIYLGVICVSYCKTSPLTTFVHFLLGSWSFSHWFLWTFLHISDPHVCKFTHVLKYICDRQTLALLSWPITYTQRGEKREALGVRLPAEFERGRALPPCFSFQTVNKSSFHGLLSATFPACVIFIGDLAV